MWESLLKIATVGIQRFSTKHIAKMSREARGVLYPAWPQLFVTNACQAHETQFSINDLFRLLLKVKCQVIKKTSYYTVELSEWRQVGGKTAAGFWILTNVRLPRLSMIHRYSVAIPSLLHGSSTAISLLFHSGLPSLFFLRHHSCAISSLFHWLFHCCVVLPLLFYRNSIAIPLLFHCYAISIAIPPLFQYCFIAIPSCFMRLICIGSWKSRSGAIFRAR